MKKIVIIIGVVVVILGIFIFYNRSKQKDTRKQISVSQGNVRQDLTISGTIEAREKTTLRFQSAGRITSIAVKTGQNVKKYQHIASLDERQLANGLQQLLNTYMSSRTNFEQVKSDNQTQAELNPSELLRERAKRLIDQAQFSLNNAVLAVEAQTLSREFAHLYSPIDGIITQVPDALAGVNISTPSQAEFHVVNPKSIYIEAVADQTEVTKLTLGESAQITLDSFPDATFSGTVTMISFTPKTDEIGTAYRVEISLPLDQIPQQFRLGMTGDVTFTTQEKQNVITIPNTSITIRDGKQYVSVYNNGKIEEREIKIGLEGDLESEVLEGLRVGDIIYDRT